ncbi:MAG: magnesium transporter CorA family protein [Bacteroidetes bacterium]|nr:magnesium transporter CorA family protein [Bacteroidota bacterium]
MKTFLKDGIGLVSIEKWEAKCWINIEQPTQEDKAYLLQEIQIPEAFYNDIEDVDERPRIEIEDGWTLIILRLPYKSADLKSPFSTIPLGLIFKGDIFVSICFHNSEVIPDFITYTKRKRIKIKDSYYLVFRLLLSSSVWFQKYLKQINQNIKSAENQLEKSIRNEDLQTLLQLEKCLVFFTTSLKGNDILVHRLKNTKHLKDTFDYELVEDVEIELRQALETTNVYSNILSGMMDAYASVISNNLNVIMKQLTSISLILMIPTLIASLYGMNVPNALENNKSGFWIVLLISLGFSSFGVIIFMKRKWF